MSHDRCHKRGLGFFQDGSERESDSTGTSADLLSSGYSDVTLDESQPQGKAGLAAHSALSRCTRQHVGSPHVAKASLDRLNATISPGREESPTTPLMKELGSAQQTDTDPVQINLDLALCAPDFQGDAVWILTPKLHLKSLP